MYSEPSPFAIASCTGRAAGRESLRALQPMAGPAKAHTAPHRRLRR